MISTRHLLGHSLQHGDEIHTTSAPYIDTQNSANTTAAQPLYYPTPIFNKDNRYTPDAPYNLAPRYALPKGFALPLARNFDYSSFIKTTIGNNTETNQKGLDLPLYIDIPDKTVKGSFQWDSFPAGEAQQFLVFSVASKLINSQPLFNGETNGATPVVLDAISSSATERPFTISLTVTPYNAGPIPHIHWAEDEWFILLQGEMDSWIGDPTGTPYELNQFPKGSEPLPSNYDGTITTANNINTFYYGHLTAGQSVYLPRGFAHSYRNASPSGDPLVFLTIWSRTPGYPQGGIEQFFTLPKPLIGRFYDTSNNAAAYGNFDNKNVGSTDGVSNQQRMVDYYNTFPDYFVAMSRNFGSFTSPDSNGGNWNPAIANDTAPIPNPPPSYWLPESSTPWLADANTPGRQKYYLPPGPNAPSKAVSFATPFDPTVVQISTFTYTGATDTSSVLRFERDLAAVVSILNSAEGAQYSLLLKPKASGQPANTYIIQTTWDQYSDLDTAKGNSELKAALSKALQTSTLSTDNNTVNSDILSPDNAQILVGRFQIAAGNVEQVLQLSATLREQTLQESGCVSFEYYQDETDPLKIVYIEQYVNGAELTKHLTATYCTDFFAKLGPLTKTGLLGDGDVGIYPVNDAISQFYPTQVQGINTLEKILTSMPELQLTLNATNGLASAVVPSGSKDLGGYINFSLATSAKQNYTYGYIDPDSKKPVIVFEYGRNLAGTSTLSSVLERKVAISSGQELKLFRTTQTGRQVIQSGLNRSTQYSTSQSLTKTSSGNLTFKEMTLSLDTPYQGIQHVSSLSQTSAKAIVDLTQSPRRDLTGQVQLYNNAGKIVSPSRVNYGFYQLVNDSGSIKDPISGKTITTSQPSYNPTLARAIDSNEMTDNLYLTRSTTPVFEGGSNYAPYVQINGATYTPYNSDVKIIGVNSFLFNTRSGSYITSLDISTSDNLPLLS